MSQKGEFCSVCAVTQVICSIYPSPRSKSFQINQFDTPSADFIRTHVNLLSPALRVGRQEDVTDFLEYLFDHFTTCSSSHLSKSHDLLLTPSIIDQTFRFTIVTSAKCSSCSHVYDKIESLNMLFVEIDNLYNLPDALSHFVKQETLEKTVCTDGCGQRGEIFKRITFLELPPVLIITLKRNQSSFGSTRKLLHQVNYSELLDMSPYMNSHFNIPYNNNPETNSSNNIYRLYAVINHVGKKLTHGHYYSYIRSADDFWYLLNDANSRKVSSNVVFNHPDAYVLFYAKISNTYAHNCSALQREDRPTRISPRENNDRIEKRSSAFDSPVSLFFQLDESSCSTVA